MKTMRREICWLAVCVFVAAIAAVPLVAVVNGRWASEAALGDVVISYDNVVRFYDNATGDEKDSNPSTPLGISVPGNNFGIAFDGALNLFVTNQNGNTSSVQRISEELHQPLTPTFTTQAAPRSIVFAGNGDYFVASRTTVATEALIRRYNSTGSQLATFTVTLASSGTCIGIDLDANQTTLYIVDGATGSQVTRLVRRLNVGSGSPNMSALPTALPGTAGAACAIRALPPVRGSNPTPGDPTAGGFLVADKVDIKQLGANGAQIGQGFDAGTNSPSDDNWMDVDLDPNSFDFWGLDSSQFIAAKFRIGSPPNALQPVISNLPTGARGLTVNGALRAAQTIRLLQQVTENNLSITTPAFNFGTDYAHTWQVKPETDQPVSAFLSVQAIEGRSDGIPAQGEMAEPANNKDGICPVSLDLDCRVFEFFRQTPAPPLVKPSPPAKKYSRNRAVFYNVTELQQTPVSSSVQLLIKVMRAVYASPGPGAACVPGGPTQPASSILRDKYPHTSSTRAGYSVFTEDGTILFGSLIKRTFNHYIAVDRQNTLYSAFMVKPTGDQNIGSTLQVAVEIRDPRTNCSVVSGLVESKTLAVAFLDVAALAIIADSEGVSTGVTTSGLQFVQAAGQYRANVTLTNPPFVVGRTYRACVTAKAEPADPDTPPAQRAIGEVCSPNFKVLGSNKK
jgi:hypothetical protein